MCRRIGEYISLELFDFVNLTSCCSLIPYQLQFRRQGECQQKRDRCMECKLEKPDIVLLKGTAGKAASQAPDQDPNTEMVKRNSNLIRQYKTSRFFDKPLVRWQNKG